MKPTVTNIKLAVARCCGLTMAELDSISHTRRIARPRQIAMYLTREMLGTSYPTIGRRFGGRDHTTALNGHRRISALLETDPDVRDIVTLVRNALQGPWTPPVARSSLVLLSPHFKPWEPVNALPKPIKRIPYAGAEVRG